MKFVKEYTIKDAFDTIRNNITMINMMTMITVNLVDTLEEALKNEKNKS